MLKVVLILIYINGIFSDAYKKQRTSARSSLRGCIHDRNSKRGIEGQKMLIIPSLKRTQHCDKRQWLWRCNTKLNFEAAELMEFRWLVYISNFIKQNYPVESYVHDDPKLTQPIFLCSVSDRNETKFIFNPLNTKLIPICHLQALLGTHPILHVSRIRVKC